jgi:hypothetical protein
MDAILDKPSSSAIGTTLQVIGWISTPVAFISRKGPRRGDVQH